MNTVGNMRRDELKALMREVLLETLAELNEESTNPVFKPEIAQRLRKFLDEQPPGTHVDDVARELGLDI